MALGLPLGLAAVARVLQPAQREIEARPIEAPTIEMPAPPVSSAIPEREVLGIPFAMLDMASVVKLLADRPASGQFAYVATPNVHHLVLLRRSVPGFAFGLSRAWFLTCDSQVLRRLAALLFRRQLP